MKKHLLVGTIAILSTPAAALAQNTDAPKAESPIKKGTVVVGSGIGLGSLAFQQWHADRKSAVYDFSLSPSVGRFVTDHWLISASVFGSTSRTFRYYGNSLFQETNIRAGVGMGARYYFGKSLNSDQTVKKLRFFAEAGITGARGWNTYKEQRPTGLVQRSGSFYGIAHIGAGVNYLLNENVALEAGLGYNQLFPRHNPGITGGGSLNLNLGVRVFLHRR